MCTYKKNLCFLFLLFLSVYCHAGKKGLFEYEIENNVSSKSFVLFSPGKRSGMFSVFTTVLGFLDFYDKGSCSGIKIDFRKKGLYFDPSQGDNWWSYYFEPVSLGATKDVFLKKVPTRWNRKFTKTGFSGLSRERAYALIQKYVHVKKDIQSDVAEFKKKHFSNEITIGIHYRGTDKKKEARRVPYHEAIGAIEQYLANQKIEEFKIFVATDELPFLEEMNKKFKEKIIFIPAYRSKDEKPVHFTYKNFHEMGKQAVIDCILLSETDILFRTRSNLSLCSGYFNPDLPIVDLY